MIILCNKIHTQNQNEFVKQDQLARQYTALHVGMMYTAVSRKVVPEKRKSVCNNFERYYG